MHELSIVVNILDVVEENAARHNATVVHEIEMEVGELSGVEFDALSFAMEHAPKSEMLKDVTFTIRRIQPVARCNECDHPFATNEYSTACPHCGSFKTEIIRGNELRIKSFNMD